MKRLKNWIFKTFFKEEADKITNLINSNHIMKESLIAQDDKIKFLSLSLESFNVAKRVAPSSPLSATTYLKPDGKLKAIGPPPGRPPRDLVKEKELEAPDNQVSEHKPTVHTHIVPNAPPIDLRVGHSFFKNPA